MERVFSFFPMKAGNRQAAHAILLATSLFCPCAGWSWEIVGSVKGDDGSPIAGIAVTGFGEAINTHGDARAVTADDGSFRLSAFDGSWTVWTDNNALWLRGYGNTISKHIIVIGADERVDFVCPKLVFTMRLSGRLIDEQGVPLANAGISMTARNGSGGVAANTDEAGRFDLPLFGGFWDLFTGPGSRREVLMPQTVLRTVDGVDQTNSVFVARIPTTEVVVSFRNASGSNINDLVYDGNLSAAATMGNTIYRADFPTIDPSGRFIFHLPEGTWILNAGPVFLRDPGVTIGIPDRTITVTGTHQDVSWVARNPTNHVCGRLVDGLGAPMGDVRISAYSLMADGLVQSGTWTYHVGNSAWAWTRTDPDGRFDFSLFAGLWKLSAERPAPDGPAVDLRVSVIDGLDRTNLQLIAQGFTTEITGSVTDISGQPVDRIFVGASTKTGEQVFSTSGYTDRQGKFRLPAFSADWRVSAEEPYIGFQTLRRTIPAKAVSVRGTNAVVEFVAEPVMLTARLRGQVVDSAGATVSGLFVHASRSDGGLLAQAETGYSGAFDLGVRGGSWVISTDNFQDGNWFYLGPKISVEVRDGVNQTNLLLVAQRTTSRITGTVADTDGRGVAGLSLSASTELQGTNYFVNGETDQEGRFWMDVKDASWEMRVGDNMLNALGFQCLAARAITVAGAGEALNFVAHPIIGDGRILTLLSSIRLSDGAFQLRATSQTAQRYVVEASQNLRDWAAASTNLTLNGSFMFTDYQGTNAQRRFYRATLLE
jgi:hypothetical protein